MHTPLTVSVYEIHFNFTIRLTKREIYPGVRAAAIATHRIHIIILLLMTLLFKRHRFIPAKKAKLNRAPL